MVGRAIKAVSAGGDRPGAKAKRAKAFIEDLARVAASAIVELKDRRGQPANSPGGMRKSLRAQFVESPKDALDEYIEARRALKQLDRTLEGRRAATGPANGAIRPSLWTCPAELDQARDHPALGLELWLEDRHPEGHRALVMLRGSDRRRPQLDAFLSKNEPRIKALGAEGERVSEPKLDMARKLREQALRWLQSQKQRVDEIDAA